MLYVYTFCTDENKTCYLQESALINNVKICYIKNNTWNGYSDKIFEMDKKIKEHSDYDIICFIDAYDVLVNQNFEYLLEKFKDYKCDLLIGAELNCFPDIYHDDYPVIDSKYKYVNSGGYIGYKYALQDLFNWKSPDVIRSICCYGGDQTYFTKYFISKHSNKIRLDTQCIIFQNMHLVDWNELSFNNGRVYNKILNTKPCFVHFNGGTWQQHNFDNIMPVFIEKMKTTMQNATDDDLTGFSQIITKTCYPHSQL